jgi:hypothetical protein
MNGYLVRVDGKSYEEVSERGKRAERNESMDWESKCT